jgi:hypothetical protein
MDETMQRNHVVLFAKCFAILACVLAFAQSTTTQFSSSVAQQYCNENYMFCVDLPELGKVVPHYSGTANHGVEIELPQPESEVWVYAGWDASLLQSSRKVLINKLDMLRIEHPNAKISVRHIVLSGISAYRIKLRYQDPVPMIEEIVIEYRKPKNESAGPGVIYEIGLKGSQNNYSNNIVIFNAFINTFRVTEE